MYISSEFFLDLDTLKIHLLLTVTFTEIKD